MNQNRQDLPNHPSAHRRQGPPADVPPLDRGKTCSNSLNLRAARPERPRRPASRVGAPGGPSAAPERTSPRRTIPAEAILRSAQGPTSTIDQPSPRPLGPPPRNWVFMRASDPATGRVLPSRSRVPPARLRDGGCFTDTVVPPPPPFTHPNPFLWAQRTPSQPGRRATHQRGPQTATGPQSKRVQPPPSPTC